MNDTLRQLLEYMNQLGKPDPQIAAQVAAAQPATQDPPAGISAPDPRTVYSQMSPEEYQAQNMNQGKSLDDGMGGVEMSELQPDDALGLPSLAKGVYGLGKVAGKAVSHLPFKAQAAKQAFDLPAGQAAIFRTAGRRADSPEERDSAEWLAREAESTPMGDRIKHALSEMLNRTPPPEGDAIARALPVKKGIKSAAEQAEAREYQEFIQDWLAKREREGLPAAAVKDTTQVTTNGTPPYSPKLTEELLRHLAEKVASK